MTRAASSLEPIPKLRFDRQVVPDMRVRLWEYSASHFLATPAGAHPFVELGWIDSGSAEYRIGKRTFEVSAGSMILIPMDVDHATGFGAGLSGGALHLKMEVFAEAADAMGPSTPAATEPGLLTPSPRLRQLIALLVAEAEDPGPGSALALNGLSDAVTIEALRRAPASHFPVADDIEAQSLGAPRKPRDLRIKRAVAEIEATLGEALSVDDLARAASMSRFHFSRLFREETGESPYRYVLLARLGRAVSLLRSGRHGVTEAAFAAGFTDLGRFCRLFRERFGQSPSVFVAARSKTHVN
jgi:AraC family transcriptional regulator